MESIHAVLDLARVALDAERLQISVAAENIANMNSANYVHKTVNKTYFFDLLNANGVASFGDATLYGNDSLNLLVEENPTIKTHLDKEVFNLSNAEIRYQSLAQMINSKLGLLALVVKGRGQ